MKNNKIYQIISKIGGKEKVARVCGVSQGAVLKWVSRDHIPAKYYNKIKKLSDFHREILSDEIFFGSK